MGSGFFHTKKRRSYVNMAQLPDFFPNLAALTLRCKHQQVISWQNLRVTFRNKFLRAAAQADNQRPLRPADFTQEFPREPAPRLNGEFNELAALVRRGNGIAVFLNVTVQ